MSLEFSSINDLPLHPYEPNEKDLETKEFADLIKAVEASFDSSNIKLQGITLSNLKWKIVKAEEKTYVKEVIVPLKKHDEMGVNEETGIMTLEYSKPFFKDKGIQAAQAVYDKFVNKIVQKVKGWSYEQLAPMGRVFNDDIKKAIIQARKADEAAKTREGKIKKKEARFKIELGATYEDGSVGYLKLEPNLSAKEYEKHVKQKVKELANKQTIEEREKVKAGIPLEGFENLDRKTVSFEAFALAFENHLRSLPKNSQKTSIMETDISVLASFLFKFFEDLNNRNALEGVSEIQKISKEEAVAAFPRLFIKYVKTQNQEVEELSKEEFEHINRNPATKDRVKKQGFHNLNSMKAEDWKKGEVKKLIVHKIPPERLEKGLEAVAEVFKDANSKVLLGSLIDQLKGVWEEPDSYTRRRAYGVEKPPEDFYPG
jgi:hypothetical protein